MFKNIVKFFRSRKQEVSYCKRCGRRLSTKESKELGFGQCCLKKENNKFTKSLF